MARQPIVDTPLSAAQQAVVEEQAAQGRPLQHDDSGPRVTAICHHCSLTRKGLTQSQAVTFRREHQQHSVHLAEELPPVTAPLSEPERWSAALIDHLQELQRTAEHCRALFRATAQDATAHVLRLHIGDARDARLVAEEAAGALRAFTRALESSKAIITSIATPLQAQLVAAQQAREAPASAATLAPLTSEVVADRLSQHEETLHVARKALTALRTAVGQAEGRANLFDQAARVVCEAALLGLRAHQLQYAATRLAAIKAELQDLRGEHPDEAAVISCCRELDVRTGAPLTWPPDLLQPPT